VDHTEVELDRPSVINCDGLHTVAQAALAGPVGEVGGDTMRNVCSPGIYALGGRYTDVALWHGPDANARSRAETAIGRPVILPAAVNRTADGSARLESRLRSGPRDGALQLPSDVRGRPQGPTTRSGRAGR
jgi:hypothetical protein